MTLVCQYRKDDELGGDALEDDETIGLDENVAVQTPHHRARSTDSLREPLLDDDDSSRFVLVESFLVCN